MKVYVTKYALTKGVYATDAEEVGDGMVQEGKRSGRYFHGEGRDWHRTWESAEKRAKAMLAVKLASLEKSAKKFRAMTFAKPEER